MPWARTEQPRVLMQPCADLSYFSRPGAPEPCEVWWGAAISNSLSYREFMSVQYYAKKAALLQSWLAQATSAPCLAVVKMGLKVLRWCFKDKRAGMS